MTTRRYFANNVPQQTLNASITSSATSCVINGSFSGWPTQFPYFAELDYGTASAEIVLVTNVSGTTATITRAQGGTAAISHAAGATLDHVAVAQDLDEANAHTVATAGVHGISGSVVGTSDSQTLSNKTLTAPVVTGTLAGATATWSGNVSVSGTNSVTGASTAASYTANGDGAVTGVLVSKTYTNESAASTALGTPVVGTEVWLTAPTGGGDVGTYIWNGSAWKQSLVLAPTAGGKQDTGWVALTLAAGFTGSVYYRRFNGVVYMRGNIARTGGYAANTTYTVAAAGAISAGYLPANAGYYAVAGNSGVDLSMVAVGTDGSLQVLTSAGVSSFVPLNNVVYIAEA